jgi:hypothetical protein
MVLDERSGADRQTSAQMIPGAIRIAMEEIEERHAEIPRDHDVVLYCSRPNEATSAVWRCTCEPKESPGFARPKGGIDAWLAYNFPFVTEASSRNLLFSERRYFSQLSQFGQNS